MTSKTKPERTERKGDSQPMSISDASSQDVTPSLIQDIQQHGDVTGIGSRTVANICAMLEQRTLLGVQRYGHPLQTHNGRDAGLDALEECCDLTQYLKQRLMEHPTNPKYRIALWNAISLLFMLVEN